jgi:hypothetical protein
VQAEAGDGVEANVGFIAGERCRRYAQGSDVVQPVFEPFRNGRRSARGGDEVGVPLGLEVLDLLTPDGRADRRKRTGKTKAEVARNALATFAHDRASERSWRT